MPARRQGELQVELIDGAIKVAAGDRVLSLPNASAPADMEENVDFVVALDDIGHWDAPNQAEEIDIETVRKIVRAIEMEFDKLCLGIAFE